MGFPRIPSGDARIGYLLNVHPTLLRDDEALKVRSAVDCYFISSTKETFKVSLLFMPYFYLIVQEQYYREVEAELRRTYETSIESMECVEKEDLTLKNHLSGLRKKCMKVNFLAVPTLVRIRSELDPIIQANKQRTEMSHAYDAFSTTSSSSSNRHISSYLQFIDDIREYDIPYYTRVTIDKDLRSGTWYNISFDEGLLQLSGCPQMVSKRPDLSVLAFDIETTKMPLKFPDSETDQIMMISYMFNRQGHLIINRSIVSQDIEDFEFTPRPEYEGPFQVFNAPDEKALLKRFFDHIAEVKPLIFVTFNGDFFDWPFIDARATINGMPMEKAIGVKFNAKEECYTSRYSSHLDCFCWVQRDSYLPHGSHGLKAVTKAKLGFDPLELDPEDMTRLASEEPVKLASYSVSDAVSTYYLFIKHIYPFIFSLCTIIPLNPDDVLRKGSGTLCENLLMVEAYKAKIIYPNKNKSNPVQFHKDHLLDSETYVGGHVESLESGIFRCDLPTRFRLDVGTIKKLIADVDEVILFAAKEADLDPNSISNRAEVHSDITRLLDQLASVGVSDDGRVARREECPTLVHVDVAAMYPNIIITNRLQPHAITNDEICAACIHNKAENRCKKKLSWQWRGECFRATRQEYESLRAQISTESFMVGTKKLLYHELPAEEQVKKLKERITVYCSKAYGKRLMTQTEMREETVCMRETPFYVETVRAFRDRRYQYKNLHKTWCGKREQAIKEGNTDKIAEAVGMVILYDSQQLAHKCILNSFYGYVMRKGARWRSMEMAGIVTHTGFQIITKAREFISNVGRPLELDTDGIWCIFPKSFPANYTLKTPERNYNFSFPCTVLNRNIYLEFANPQYQLLQPNGTYKLFTECTIGFEVDGPYRAICLPASKEKDKKLKKRYVVLTNSGDYAELKGFELKRRGELKLIKNFQSEVFKEFLNGSSLEETYHSAANVANHFLDILEQGKKPMEENNLSDEYLLDLLTESSNMSRQLKSYGAAKTTQVTTAKRLAEFLGEQVVQDKGLKCAYVISKKPNGAKVTERAIPTAIFAADPRVRQEYLTKWIGSDEPLRLMLDWEYYWTRLESTIQKIITIPASLQGVSNPVPRIEHPDWLLKQHHDLASERTQKKIDMFTRRIQVDIESLVAPPPQDAEDDNIARKRKRQEDDPTVDDEVKRRRVNERPNLEAENNEDDSDSDDVGENEDHRRVVQLSLSKFISHEPVNKPLQVLRITEAGLGEFTFWVITGGSKIDSLRVSVPRIFYVNSTVEDKSLKKVSLEPPRGKPSYFMHEVKLAESQYTSNPKIISELISSPQIEGIYERHIPLLFRCLMSVGSVCQVPSGSRQLYDLDSFESCPHSEYLANYSNLKKLFLYYVTCDTRTTIGLFSLMDNSASVFVASPFNNPVNFTKAMPVVIKHSKVLKDKSAAFKKISNLLIESLEMNNALLICQSNVDQRQLHKDIPTTTCFCTIRMPFNSNDANFPALGWETFALGRMHKNFCEVEPWIKRQLEYALYANIPLGNIENDNFGFLADIFFARALRKNQCLLWISGNNKPDLGGAENDDTSGNETVNPEICEPGYYDTISIEINLSGLAINTVLQVDKIFASELNATSALRVGSDTTLSVAHGSVSDCLNDVSRQFKVLRELVLMWFKDLGETDNPIAEELLDQFYRWISAPRAYLYDPLIHQHFHGLMKKAFMQLLLEFRKLGSRIVFANFKKIIINTDKASRQDASEYFTFCLEALKKNHSELVILLDLTPVHYWESLLFVDLHNYGGILQKPADNCDRGNPVEPPIAHWNIAHSLPDKRLQSWFELMVTKYLALRASGSPTAVANSKSDVISLPEDFVQGLIGLVKDIKNSRDRNEKPLETALLFAKSVCYVLSFDKNAEKELHQLKINLLKLLGVGEFASEAQFDNSHNSYVIQDVFCSYCNDCRDIDLLRDPCVMKSEWLCPMCNHKY
ncbi:DNA polymerase epsilon catalytic subunit A [Pelomyxa schiedti]|nr:DNA polymerase epsilon catalytic subunit A [Pelomyxa schiedti]